MMNELEGDKTVNEEKIFSETITANYIDKLLDLLRKDYYADFFEKNEKWLVKVGLWGLYFAGILGLIASIFLSIRYDLSFFKFLGIGIGWLLFCVVVHYTAYKFLPVLNQIIKATPSKLSSTAFLDSVALLLCLGGIFSLFGGLYLGIETRSFDIFIIGLFLFIFAEYLLSLCLNPEKLNIEVSEKTSAGEEFLGLIAFFMKGFLKLVPIIFGSGIIIGIINLIDMFYIDFGYYVEIYNKAFQVGNFMSAALLPVLGYFLFLGYFFFIDIAMSVLAIPAKIDALKKIEQ